MKFSVWHQWHSSRTFRIFVQTLTWSIIHPSSIYPSIHPSIIVKLWKFRASSLTPYTDQPQVFTLGNSSIQAQPTSSPSRFTSLVNLSFSLSSSLSPFNPLLKTALLNQKETPRNCNDCVCITSGYSYDMKQLDLSSAQSEVWGVYLVKNCDEWGLKINAPEKKHFSLEFFLQVGIVWDNRDISFLTLHDVECEMSLIWVAHFVLFLRENQVCIITHAQCSDFAIILY